MKYCQSTTQLSEEAQAQAYLKCCRKKKTIVNNAAMTCHLFSLKRKNCSFF